jgi:ABC-type phosphate/phosphonate transport system substrate-binding protein
MFATLPMYDWPEVRDATDAYWKALAERLGVEFGLARTLTHGNDWQRPDLYFSQTCGYPFTHELKGQLTYVATPHFGARGCNGPHYRSIIFSRDAAKVRSGTYRAAVNSMNSMSGMLALRLAGFDCGDRVMSGSHVNSLGMVQKGEADVCAIDAVCVALAQRYRPWLFEGLTVLGESPSVPGLPYVTRCGEASMLFAALKDVFQDNRLADVRDALLLVGISSLGASAYDVIPALETQLSAGSAA